MNDTDQAECFNCGDTLEDHCFVILQEHPDALLALVRNTIPNVVVFVDGPEVRERVGLLLERWLDIDEGMGELTAAVIAALTTGGAT